MIERRFKSEYDSSYKQIRRVIANYITLVINYPQNFELKLNKKQNIDELRKYLNESDEEELLFLLFDLYNSTFPDISSIASIFGIIFNIIHEDNIENKPNFFNLDKVKKNLAILTSLFERCPLTAQVYVQEANFNPALLTNYIVNGKNFQAMNFLSPYLNIAIFEADVNLLRNNIPSTKPTECDTIIKNYTNRLNDYLNTFVTFIYSIYSVNEITRQGLLDWVYKLIVLNFDRTKMYQMLQNCSTLGYLLNVLKVLLKIFFDQQTYLSKAYSEFIFKTVADIDPLFTLSNNKLNFSKYERVNPDLVKQIIENEEDDEYNYKDYNLTTQLFFIINNIAHLTLKTFDDEITQISQKLEQLYNENKTNDPMYKDYYSIIKAASCYLKNNELSKNLIKFSEVSSVFLFSLNNKKYPQITMDKQQIDYEVYIEEFFDFIETNDNFALSLVPVYIPKNILTNSIFIRRHNSDVLINEIKSTKISIYFSIIYSSHIELIRNPHLRSEIFDILTYLFVINNFEKNQKIATICKILNEPFVRNSLVISVMRVFIDAERLGTSNQFYEKFSIRHKILYLLDNLMKANKSLLTQKIIDYANDYKEDCTKMINLLMNDITFLNDECIERLMDMKRYQDLKDDEEKYKSLDEEMKKHEDDKFKENDRRIKTELKLFSSSMDFMVLLSKICQENFLSLKLGEKLANLLNYSLDVFTSSRGLKLKIKNMKDYGFDPKHILTSLISIYVNFLNYKEFLEYIVKDERSFKIENFEKVSDIYSRGKIKFVDNTFESFEILIRQLKEIDIEIKNKIINFDDAPDEFLDPIAAVLMEDPVLLPSSKMIVDRNTIQTHLLSDPTDPFNRSSLTSEMLVPMIELKARIEEYKNQKLLNKN
jgi:ubiquitin conjugation factor E4 B